jgi:hypothetical protein
MRGSGAMFGAELDAIPTAMQIQIGIAPAVQVTGSAQSLAGPIFSGGFSGMVDKQHGRVEAPLKVTEEGKDRGDLGGMIFIDRMQTDERIEDQKARVEEFDRNGELAALAVLVEM